MKDEIGIADWSEEIIADLKRFADMWNAKRESGNTLFPEKMQRGDWDEQFHIFSDTIGKWRGR